MAGLPRAAPGQPIYADDWNRLVDALEQALRIAAGGDGEYIANASGIFPVPPRTRVIREGVLDGDLAASTDSGETEQTATMSIWEGKGDNWQDTGRNLTVTNRDDNFSASEGDRIVVQLFGSEWRPQAGGGCADRNEIWDINVGGLPTGGTFDLTFTLHGVEDTITLNWNDASADVLVALEGHSGAASSDTFTVTGGPFPGAEVRVECEGGIAGTAILPPLSDHGSLTGGSGVVVIVERVQPGHPD